MLTSSIRNILILKNKKMKNNTKCHVILNRLKKNMCKRRNVLIHVQKSIRDKLDMI